MLGQREMTRNSLWRLMFQCKPVLLRQNIQERYAVEIRYLKIIEFAPKLRI